MARYAAALRVPVAAAEAAAGEADAASAAADAAPPRRPRAAALGRGALDHGRAGAQVLAAVEDDALARLDAADHRLLAAGVDDLDRPRPRLASASTT